MSAPITLECVFSSPFGIVKQSFGLAGYLVTITDRETSKKHCLDGDLAEMFLKEYDDLKNDHHNVPNSRASRFKWHEILDEMCGAYFA